MMHSGVVGAGGFVVTVTVLEVRTLAWDHPSLVGNAKVWKSSLVRIRETTYTIDQASGTVGPGARQIVIQLVLELN